MEEIKLQFEQAIDVTKGVRSNVEPYYLEPGHMYYLKNANLEKLGSRKKRYGSDSYGTNGTELGGIGPWVRRDGQFYFVGYWDNVPYRTIKNKVWEAIGSNISLSTDHLLRGTYGRIQRDANTTAHFVYSVKASSSNPTLSPLHYILQDGGGTMNASIHPKTVEWWQGRLWVSGCVDDDLFHDAIYWSTILDGSTFDLDNNVRVDPEHGGSVVKLIPVRDQKPRLYIFKERSIHALDVVWTGGAQIPTTEVTIDTINSKIVPISTDIGTVAPNTVVHVGGGGDSDVFFLARDGVRSLRRVEGDVAGGAGDPISEPIKDIIERINWEEVEIATAAVYDFKLFIAIPVDDSTYNNLTIVYDLEEKRWIGEYDYSIIDFLPVTFTRGNTTPAKIEMLMGAWASTTSDFIDSATTTTYGSHVFRFLDSDSNVDPNNSAIEYIEETPAYKFGNLGKLKRWNWMELEFTPATTNITLSIYAKVDDQDYQLLTYMGVEPNWVYPILPAQLPWEMQSSAKSIQKQSLMELPPGKTIQFKIVTDSPGAFGTRTTRAAAWPYHENWE